MPEASGYQRRTSVVRGILAVLLAMFLFAAMDAINKHQSLTYAASQILLVRYVVFALFSLWLARRHLGAYVRSRRPGLQVLRSMLLIVEMLTFVLALRYMPIADVHAVAASTPLMVTALSRPLLGESVSARQWLAVIGGFVGVLIIVRPGIIAFDWPVLLVLAGAAMFAFYQIALRVVSRDDPPETTVIYSAFVGLTAVSTVGPFQWQTPDLAAWALFVVAALLGCFAHLAMTRALDYAPAAVVQPYSYTLMVWAALMGWIGFSQFPDLWTIVGGAVVAASGLYAWVSSRPAAPAR